MTAPLHCHGCQRRLGKRARVLLVTGSTLLCHACAGSHAVHAEIFFSCGERHTPAEHASCVVLSRGRAAQAIAGGIGDNDWYKLERTRHATD